MPNFMPFGFMQQMPQMPQMQQTPQTQINPYQNIEQNKITEIEKKIDSLEKRISLLEENNKKNSNFEYQTSMHMM